MILTYRYRVKDKHRAALNAKARAVNFVWNYCNDTQRTAVARGARWPSHFDLTMLMTGVSKALGLPSGTIGQVAKQYRASLRESRRRKLRYRGRRSLGWVPFQGRAVKMVDGRIRHGSATYSLSLSRPLPSGAKIVDGGSFGSDARGRWYLNLVLEVSVATDDTRPPLGMDLGLRSIATLSDGRSFPAPRIFRRQAARLAVAQRGNRKRLAKAVLAKVAAQRRDFLHKLSTEIARTSGDLYVGNVSSAKLVRTRFAKSVLDASWSTLRRFLSYKAIARGRAYREVDERNTTQTCSGCGCLGGPKGRKGLVMRAWTCQHCGASHDRDVNAARNILTLGLRHQALDRGAASLAEMPSTGTGPR